MNVINCYKTIIISEYFKSYLIKDDPERLPLYPGNQNNITIVKDKNNETPSKKSLAAKELVKKTTLEHRNKIKQKIVN
jgi:hypothetical protein